MDTIISDISAFLYWRTPPIARLLASGPEADSFLRNLVDRRRIRKLRLDLLEASPRAAAVFGAGRRWFHFGDAGEELAASFSLLATDLRGPIDVLCDDGGARRPSSILRPRVWSGASPDALVRIDDNLLVTSPALTVQQLATRSTLLRAALLLTELFGSFSVYHAPEPLAELLQELADKGRLVPYCGWRAAIDNNGRLTGLWSRPPLLTHDLLRAHLNSSASKRGRRRLREASDIALSGSASPLEAQAGLLLGAKPRHGGEGYDGMVPNRCIILSREARKLARQTRCYCDLFWERHADDDKRGIDVECQSSSHHFGSRSAPSDADRATALQQMGIEVIQLTYAQLADEARLEAFSRLLAKKLGTPYHAKSDKERQAQRELRAEALRDWEGLPYV